MVLGELQSALSFVWRGSYVTRSSKRDSENSRYAARYQIIASHVTGSCFSENQDIDLFERLS